jgi:hypothetical protein
MLFQQSPFSLTIACDRISGTHTCYSHPSAWHQYLQYKLISHIEHFKRKRGRQNFNELFEKANEKLRKLNEEPDRLRRRAG